MAGGYFFLPAACFAATACFFFWSALLAMACFCDDFFWLDFGDLSPIIFIFFCGFIHLRHDSFSEGKVIMLSKAVIVNDGSEIIWRKRLRGSRGPKHFADSCCYCDRTSDASTIC